MSNPTPDPLDAHMGTCTPPARKRRNQPIRQAQYFDFYDLAPAGYVTTSERASIQQANLTTAKLLGVPRADLIGKALSGFMTAPDADRYYLLCQQARASGSAQSCELRVRKADGHAIWVSLQAIAATGDDGTSVIRLVLSDITQRRQLERATHEAGESKFGLAADNTSDGIVIFGADRRVQYVSPVYVKLMGYSEAEEHNRSPDQIYALIHPEDRDALLAKLEQAIAAKANDLLYSYRFRHHMGHTIWREDHAQFKYDEAGTYAGACVAARDITERRRTELQLQASDLRYQWLVEELPVGAVMHGPDCKILRCNAKALKLLGLTEYQLLGKTSFDLQWEVIHEDGSPFPGSAHPVPQAIASRQPVRNVVMGVFRPTTQDRVWLLVSAHPQLNPDSSVEQVVAVFINITEQIGSRTAMQEMNRDLTESRQQLRNLLALNETTLEAEKRHIAREVHDELGQTLTALRMDLSLAIVRHADHAPELLNALNGMKMQVDRAVQGVRNVATSLRPAVLDMGLVTALEWLCQEFSKNGDIQCVRHGFDEGFEIDDSRAVVIFRIVQEALTNIRKYAQAEQVDITLQMQDAELSVEVRDNGLGFGLEPMADRGALGLLGMRERALALGGRLEVASTAGQGTVIALVIPLGAQVAKAPA